MKRILLISAAALVMLTSCMTSAERAQQQAYRQAQVEQAVNSGRLTISIRSMHTQRYGTRQVTPDFHLTLRGDTVESYLPYFGQAWTAGYGSQAQGLNFTTRMLDVRRTRQKHGVSRVEFYAKSQEDVYYYAVDIYPTGHATIFVRARERDNISFDGDVYLQ